MRGELDLATVENTGKERNKIGKLMEQINLNTEILITC